MRLDGLFENIDDKDEFIAKCPVCDLYGDEQPDVIGFHDAHMASAKVADSAIESRKRANALLGWSSGWSTDTPWWNFFKDDMAKRGYQRQMGVWVRVPVTEDLDDKDEFESSCNSCYDQFLDQGRVPFGFHEAHLRAQRIAADAVYAHHREAASGELFNMYETTFNKVMHELGWVEGKHHEWTKATVKEDLDDKDEFKPDQPCEYCGAVSYYDRSNIDFDEFHIAHTQSEGLATDNTGWFDDDTFIDEMRKKGYEKQHYLNRFLWTKTTPLKEDLDDKDEFRRRCDQCNWFARQMAPNAIPDDYHEAHRAAEENDVRPGESWHDAYTAVMKRFGYIPTQDAWIKEDIDDTDEFGAPGISAAYYENSGGHYRHVVVFADGSRLYAHTLPSDAGGDYFEKFRDSTGALHDDNWPGIVEYENAMGQHRNSYYVPFTPEIWADWKKAFGALTEDIDDKDEFKKDCMVCRVNCALNPKLDQEDYHNAHEASKIASGVGLDNPNLYVTEMAKYGYFKDYNYGMWVKR